MKLLTCKCNSNISYRNQSITEKDLITQQIRNNLYALTSICSNKQKQNISHLFFYLKHYNKNTPTCNKMIESSHLKEELKKQIILGKIINCTKVIFETYVYFEKALKSNTLKKWNFNCQLMKYVKSFEPKIKEKCLQKLSMKKEEIITQSKIEEQKLNSLKSQISSVNMTIDKYNKTIKSNKDKETLFNKNIRSLEEENYQMEKEIKKTTLSQETSNGTLNSKSDSKKIKLESKVKELETTMRKLEDEMKEKDAYFTSQVKDLNEMLDFFEEKANELSKIKNNNNNKMNRESSHHKYTTKTPNNNHNINFKIGNANQIEPNIQRINAKINSNTNSGSSRGIFININNYNSNKK